MAKLSRALRSTLCPLFALTLLHSTAHAVQPRDYIPHPAGTTAVQFLHMQRFCGCGQGWLVQAYAHSFGGGTGGCRLAVGRISESGCGRLSGVKGSGSVGKQRQLNTDMQWQGEDGD